jgi:hypothetical protein
MTFLASCRLEEAFSIAFPFIFFASGWSSSDEKSDTELAKVLIVLFSETLWKHYIQQFVLKIYSFYPLTNKHNDIINSVVE